jgi:hypothetical protein
MITPEQYLEMLARTTKSPLRDGIPADAFEEEIPLHDDIVKWCKDNRAAYIHARTDKRSTINKGAPDFMIFFQGRLIIVECKTRTGKRTTDQLAWAMLAEVNGFTVYECRSFSEFLAIVAIEKQSL